MSTYPSQYLPGSQDQEAAWNELGRVLHAEITRLPDRYRIPVILSFLEGKTNDEVATLLRWPVRRVKGRLTRAVSRLRWRLTRRGMGLSGALLLTALADGAVFAEVVPNDLIEQTMLLIQELNARPALFRTLPRARLTTSSSLGSRIATLADGAAVHRKYPLLLLFFLAVTAAIGIATALHSSASTSFLRPAASAFVPGHSPRSGCH